MNFAIYARKSVYSDKSDSVKNQISMCRDYIKLKYNEEGNISEYYDEGLTGANTNRPELKRLLADIDDGLIDVLAVYQLDRLSRDVRDFSNIYGILTEKRVEFISVKENIDTSTPIGKAMTYITMVFAQLERESIAARVTDNMIGLAKKGYWTGGNPPYGYVREKIIVDGKKHTTIRIDPEAAEWVKGIYRDFLDNDYSLQGMETAYKRAGIKTQTGAFFSTTQLYKILTMPYCVANTPEVYDYYESLGCKMDPGSPRDVWKGDKGVMIYGRSTEKNKKHQIQPKEEWLVCIGLQDPFIDADTWLEAQSHLARNKFKRERKYDVPLLKGTLRCAKCGCLMQVSRKKLKNGIFSAYYCITRQRKGIDVCDMGQTDIRKLDTEVLRIFSQIEADPETIMQYASIQEDAQEEPAVNYTAKISSLNAQIGRLTHSLAIARESTASKYILAEIERLDANIEALKREQEMQKADKRRTAREKKSVEQKAEDLKKMFSDLSGLSADEKNRIVKEVVEEMTWDGETLFLRL